MSGVTHLTEYEKALIQVAAQILCTDVATFKHNSYDQCVDDSFKLVDRVLEKTRK